MAEETASRYAMSKNNIKNRAWWKYDSVWTERKHIQLQPYVNFMWKKVHTQNSRKQRLG